MFISIKNYNKQLVRNIECYIIIKMVIINFIKFYNSKLIKENGFRKMEK